MGSDCEEKDLEGRRLVTKKESKKHWSQKRKLKSERQKLESRVKRNEDLLSHYASEEITCSWWKGVVDRRNKELKQDKTRLLEIQEKLDETDT